MSPTQDIMKTVVKDLQILCDVLPKSENEDNAYSRFSYFFGLCVSCMWTPVALHNE